jgi:hypothetical protein
MKMKLVLTLVFNLIVISIYSQINNGSQPLKYIFEAPDGSVALTVYDDVRGDTMHIESVDSFYKYQLLDLYTSEPVYMANNKGAACTINKSKVADGQYNLQIYTKNFIITSKITITHTRRLSSANEGTVALNY